MALFADIQRFKVREVLPCGPAALDQDALFWEAVSVYESALAEIPQEAAT